MNFRTVPWGSSCDIRISASNNERFWIICGPEFSSKNTGKCGIFRRTLHGMKSSELYLGNHLRAFNGATGVQALSGRP